MTAETTMLTKGHEPRSAGDDGPLATGDAGRPGAKRRSRLTAKSLANLDVGDHTDPAVPGLQMRVRARAGGKSQTWFLRYKLRGRPLRVLLGHLPAMSLADARAEALRLRGLLDRGIDPRKAQIRKRTVPAQASTDEHSIEFLVAEFIARYLRAERNGRKRPEYCERILVRDVLPVWKGRDARTITPREVLTLLDDIVERGAPIMANRVAGLLGQLFKFGLHRRIVESTPVQLLWRPGGKERPRERALSDGELKTLLVKLDDVHRREIRTAHVLRILLLTGQRRGELALARWSDIDLDAASPTWAIPDEHAKAGRGHVVPLSRWAVEEFQALKRLAERSAFVFPTTDDKAPAEGKLITRSVARCMPAWKKHGVESFTPHDLRRTCRTGLARLKVQPHIAERVMNHAQEKIPGTYDRYDYVDEKREALENWERHLRSLLVAH